MNQRRPAKHFADESFDKEKVAHTCSHELLPHGVVAVYRAVRPVKRNQMGEPTSHEEMGVFGPALCPVSGESLRQFVRDFFPVAVAAATFPCERSVTVVAGSRRTWRPVEAGRGL